MKILIVSLIISLVGIMFLLILSVYLQPISINNYSQLKQGDYVKVAGKIVSIKTYDNFSIIKLNNNITITCNCKFLINSTIQAIGKVEEYQNSMQINAEKISLEK